MDMKNIYILWAPRYLLNDMVEFEIMETKWPAVVFSVGLAKMLKIM